MKRIADSKRHTSCRAPKVLKCLVYNYTKGNERGSVWNRTIDILGFTQWNVNLQTTKERVILKFTHSKNPHRNWNNAKDNTCFGETSARWHRRQFTIFRPDCITSRPETKNGASSDNLQCFISHGELFHSSIQFSSLSFLLLELKPQ